MAVVGRTYAGALARRKAMALYTKGCKNGNAQ